LFMAQLTKPLVTFEYPQSYNCANLRFREPPRQHYKCL
jgi:hypothetical protein